MNIPKQVTLANLAESSAQEVFDWVAYKLLKQNQASVTTGEYGQMCAYRGDGGTKCAAGWLISDDEYKPEFEGNGWHVLALLGDVPNEHSDMIFELQKIHDHGNPNTWENGLYELANLNNLNSDIIGNIE